SHCKRTSLTNRTSDRYLSMMLFHNRFGQCQSDAGSAKQASFLFLVTALKKTREYLIFILFGNADTRIRNIYFYISVRYLSPQRYVSFIGSIFKGIGQKIEKYFLHQLRFKPAQYRE